MAELGKIEDLETTQLDCFGRGTDYVKEDVTFNFFQRNYTANILSW